jgi:hypothetical protein
MPAQKDNSTIRLKVALRRNLLKEIEKPVVMETHGGFGKIFTRCYSEIASGVVFEKDQAKASFLAKQRPTWAVYECDCLVALAGGVGSHLPINFIDLDPYGEPWPVLDAFLESERPFPDRLAIAVNDGLRQSLKMNGGWHVGSMESVVQKYGNDVLYDQYLNICKELLKEKAAQAGYHLRRWAGYYCGHADQMTHYAAVLEK